MRRHLHDHKLRRNPRHGTSTLAEAMRGRSRNHAEHPPSMPPVGTTAPGACTKMPKADDKGDRR